MENKGWCKCDHCLKEGLLAFEEGRWRDVLFEYDSLLIEAVREVHADDCVVWKKAPSGTLGPSSDALKQYYKSPSRESDCKDTWLNIGSLLAKMGRIEEALLCLQRAIEIDPAYTDAIELKIALLKNPSPDEQD